VEVGAGAGAAGGLEGFGAPARSLELITLSNSCGDVVSKYLATAADFSADLTSAGDALGRNCGEVIITTAQHVAGESGMQRASTATVTDAITPCLPYGMTLGSSSCQRIMVCL